MSLRCFYRVKGFAESGSAPPDIIDCGSELESPPKVAVSLSDTFSDRGSLPRVAVIP